MSFTLHLWRDQFCQKAQRNKNRKDNEANWDWMGFVSLLIVLSNAIQLGQLWGEKLVSLGSVLLASGHTQARHRLEKLGFSLMISHNAAIWPSSPSARDFPLLRALRSRNLTPSLLPIRAGPFPSLPGTRLGLFGDSEQCLYAQLNPASLGPFWVAFSLISPTRWLYCRL